MQYRPEIDGLRAVAVLPVILFHAGFSWFSGGFVGVDVFFVISGYLISGIIIEDIRTGKFTLKRFYERRFRRIAPAFTVVLLFCIFASWFLLLPGELVSFYKSVLYACVFAANIFFRGEAGYFDTASELKPLLHVWSLSVEEQFYLVFPVAALLLSSKKRLVPVLILIGIAFSFYYAEKHNTVKPNAAFFLIKYRAWELLLGTFAALQPTEHIFFRDKRVKEALSWGGLLMVVFSVFYLDQAVPFPGLWTLFPTIGCLLTLVFADAGTSLGRILSVKLIVAIGTSSYGAYLWHNPIFVFTRYVYANAPSPWIMALMTVLSLVLGYLSAKLIEKPCRDSRRLPIRRLVICVTFPLIIMIGFSALGIWKQGFYNRYSPGEVALLRSAETFWKQNLAAYDLGRCFIDYEQDARVLLQNNCVSDSNQKRVIVYGDSQAAHLMSGVKETFGTDRFAVQQWTGTSCRSIDYDSNSSRCKEFYQTFVEQIVPQIKSNDVIIVSSRWVGVITDEGASAFMRSVQNLFALLKKTGAEVVVIGSTAEFPLAPQYLMVRQGIENRGDVYLPTGNLAQVNGILATESRKYGFDFQDPTAYMCKPDQKRLCLVASGGALLYFDGGHLAPAGSRFLLHKLNLIEAR